MADQFKTFDKAPIVGVVNLKQWSFAVRELIVAGVALFLLVMCILFIALYAGEKSDNGSSGSSASPAAVISKHFCVTKECMNTASRSTRLMNASVDPCDNFYEYACGGYRVDHPYVNKQSARTTMNDIADLNTDKLLEVIERPPTRTADWAYQKKLSDYFAVCKDDYTREKKVGRPLLEQVITPLGGWDLLGTWDESKWDFNTALKKVQSDFWVDAFYSTTVTIDEANPKNRVIKVQPAGLGKWMNPSWYSNPGTWRFQQDYKKFIGRVAFLLMRDANLVNVTEEEGQQRIDQFVNDTFAIETKLAQALNSIPMAEDPFLETNKVTISNLNTETSGVIDWTTQLSYMYNTATVSGNTKLVLIRREYYKNITAMINSLPAADKKRMLHNYLIWRCAEQYAQDLSWEYIHANRDFYVDMYGYANFLGLDKFCIRSIQFYMKDALGALFAQEHMGQESKSKVLAITTNLKKALQTSLDQTPWMDAATRKYAKEKLDLVTFKLGYPDWMDDESVVDEIYSKFSINKTDFLSSLLSANQFMRKEEGDTLQKGEDRREWIFGPYDTTIAVYWYWNEIIAPAAVLQSPIYDYDAPHYTTFGSLGAILGRYLHHVVDDWGEHYDKQGENMYEKTWWSPYSVNAYKPVHTCVNNVYSKISQTATVPGGQKINVAIVTQRYTPVAIATTSGIRLALKGYKDWVSELGVNEKMLPSVGLSADQMIFLSYAQSYCFNRGNDLTAFLIRRGQVMEDVRINNAMGQLQEFSDAFKCKAGTKMNQDKKCTYY